MGVAAAFPSVARGNLLRKMRVMGIDENLVDWTDSFMRTAGSHERERPGRRPQVASIPGFWVVILG